MTLKKIHRPRSKNPIGFRVADRYSDPRNVRIRWDPGLGIQRKLMMGFDRPLKLAPDTNSLKLAISSSLIIVRYSRL